jgi:hypothetical protein
VGVALDEKLSADGESTPPQPLPIKGRGFKATRWIEPTSTCPFASQRRRPPLRCGATKKAPQQGLEIGHKSGKPIALGRGSRMSPFELVFAMFGLVLGLAVTEVLGGFSRAFKLKRSAKPVRIGWLTPLLGLFVILDLTSFWGVAYEARDQLRANYPILVAVLAIVGTYYLAATQIFPDDPEEWPDFDAYYDRHNRIVIGGMLAANLGSVAGQIALEAVSPAPAAAAAAEASSDIAAVLLLIAWLAIVALLIVLMIVKSRRWNVALLVILIVLLLAGSSVEAFV